MLNELKHSGDLPTDRAGCRFFVPNRRGQPQLQLPSSSPPPLSLILDHSFLCRAARGTQRRRLVGAKKKVFSNERFLLFATLVAGDGRLFHVEGHPCRRILPRSKKIVFQYFPFISETPSCMHGTTATVVHVRDGVEGPRSSLLLSRQITSISRSVNPILTRPSEREDGEENERGTNGESGQGRSCEPRFGHTFYVDKSPLLKLRQRLV